MSFLASADEHEAVRLAHATLALVQANPALANAAPIAVLATVLEGPPWRLSWQEAVALVSESLLLTAEHLQQRPA